MAIDYGALLSDEEKRAILNQRIKQFVNEAFQHSLNKTVAETTNNEEAIKVCDDALEVLDKAIEVHQEELTKLPSE